MTPMPVYETQLKLCVASVLLQKVQEAETYNAPVEPAAITSSSEDVGDIIDLGDGFVLSKYEVGMTTTGYSFEMAWYRQIRDEMLELSADTRNDPEVKAWLDGLGGYSKLQEKLTGIRMGDGSFYQEVKAALKHELGYDPRMGEREPTYADSATAYDGYAVDMHRMAITRAAHGEIQDPESSTPDWEFLSKDFDCQYFTDTGWIKPSWWRFMSIGKSSRWTTKVHNLKQVETGTRWQYDIRISKDLENPFSGYHIRGMFRTSCWNDNAVVKELITRFYNDPKSLRWAKTGKDGKQRWSFGMKTPNGNFIWAPLTYRASEKMDWFIENEDKPYVPKMKRALYMGMYIFVYQKKGSKILVTKYSQNPEPLAQTPVPVYQTLSLHDKKLLTPWEWGKMKNKALEAGAKDAYFGRPWMSAPPKERSYQETNYDSI